jgi:low affinity Fe/Cu permease
VKDTHELWRRFVGPALAAVGSLWSFVAAFLFLIAWLVAGFFLGFSDAWQLVLNTIASVVAFLLVFLIEYSQNRDTRALHLKLDELLRALDGPRSELVGLERRRDDELDAVARELDASPPERG